MLAERRTLLCLFHSDAIVGNRYHRTLFCLLAPDYNCASAPPVENTMLYGIFHQRLERKGRYNKVVCLDLIYYLELVPETLLFQIQVVCRMI